MNTVLNNSVHDVYYTTYIPNRRPQENNRGNEMDQTDEKHIRIKYLHAEADQIEVMMTVSGADQQGSPTRCTMQRQKLPK